MDLTTWHVLIADEGDDYVEVYRFEAEDAAHAMEQFANDPELHTVENPAAVVVRRAFWPTLSFAGEAWDTFAGVFNTYSGCTFRLTPNPEYVGGEPKPFRSPEPFDAVVLLATDCVDPVTGEHEWGIEYQRLVDGQLPEDMETPPDAETVPLTAFFDLFLY